MVYLCYFLTIGFTYRLVTSSLILKIPRESFLVFPTPSILYSLLRGIGADLSNGDVDVIVLALAGGVGAGGGG